MKKKTQSKFASGAVRGVDFPERFDLINPTGLRRLAETYGEGTLKYGDENWLKGIPNKNLMNHLMKHLNSYMLGDKSEDHLAHAAWGLFAIMHNEELLPKMNNITTRKGEK